jgi:hypothetical protein
MYRHFIEMTFYFTYTPHHLHLVPLDYYKTNNVALLWLQIFNMAVQYLTWQSR